MSPETDVAPDPVADLEAAVAERTATWGSKSPATPSKAPADKPEPTAKEDKAKSEDAAPVSGEAQQAADKGQQPPAVEPGPDLSFLPENLRSKVPNLAADFVAWVKEQHDGYLRREDYTKKTMELGETKKKADLWNALEQNPKAADAAYRMLNGEKPQEADDEIDLTTADDKTIKAFIARSIEKKAEEIAERKVAERVIAPQQARSAVGSVLADFARENAIPQEQMLQAVALSDQYATKLGIRWTPENAKDLILHGLLQVREKPQVRQPEAKSEAPGLAKVASPNNRGVGAVAPKTPSWKQAGAKGPRTDKERLEYALDLARERFGDDVTVPELETGR